MVRRPSISFAASAFLAITVIAPLLLRDLHPRVTLDDPYYLQCAAGVARGEMPYRDSVLTQLPGAEFLLGIYYAIVTPSLLATQILTACFDWLTAWILWRIGCMLSGPFVGAIAAILFSWAPATVAHHVFEPEVVSAAIIAAMMILMLDPDRKPGDHIGKLVALSSAGFFMKATFGLAIFGTAVGLALLDRRAALRYFTGACAGAVLILALLGVAFGREFFIQAILFQAMKGPLAFPQRMNSFLIATTPVLIPAIAGFHARFSDPRWRSIVVMAAATSALVLLGPTYWSHNAIDPLAPLSLLAAVGWDTARRRHADARVFFARAACGLSLVLFLFLGATGRMPFVTEGVPRTEIERATSELRDLGRAGTVMYAPSALLFESGSRGFIRHPEFYGVYLWIKESLDRDGLRATLAAASEDSFSLRMAKEKGRWEQEVYRAIEESRLLTVVYETERADSADALDRSRLLRAGMKPLPNPGYYEIWTK